eukprot:scaffold4545_cov139-Amphora_coffeaeformis.AAC.2
MRKSLLYRDLPHSVVARLIVFIGESLLWEFWNSFQLLSAPHSRAWGHGWGISSVGETIRDRLYLLFTTLVGVVVEREERILSVNRTTRSNLKLGGRHNFCSSHFNKKILWARSNEPLPPQQVLSNCHDRRGKVWT